MPLAAYFTDDQIAVLGSAIVFGGCLAMMIVSQKIGDNVRGRRQNVAPDVVRFRSEPHKADKDRKAA